MATPGITPRAYHRTKSRWYHSHIIEWMLANPNGQLADCAAYVGKSPTTLSAIIRSDMFQAALQKRKEEYSAVNDLVLSRKLTEVAIASLDTILSVVNTKKDKIPLEELTSLQDSVLKKLGYGAEVKQPTVQINQQTNNTIAVPVSPEDFAEAQMAFRQYRQSRASIPAGEGAKLIEATAEEKPLAPDVP